MKLSKTKLCKLIESCVRKQFLNESNIDELDVLHASPNKFDRFNHKKYLGKGAGTQSFGWGSYFSTNKDVIDGYLDHFSSQWENDKKFLMYQIEWCGMNDIDTDTYENYISNRLDKIVTKNKPQDQILYELNFIEIRVRNIFKIFSEGNPENLIKVADVICNELVDGNNLIFKKYCKGIQFDCEKNRWIIENRGQRFMFQNMDEETYQCFYCYLRDFSESVYSVVKSIKEIISHYSLYTISYNAYKYNVNIPDESNGNYLEWYEPLQNSQIEQMKNGLRKLEQRFPKHKQLLEVEQILNSKMQSEKFEIIYNRLKNTLGSQKAASMFLQYCGFDGIKYPPYTHWQSPDGASKDGMNYVVFDQNKAKINNVEDY